MKSARWIIWRGKRAIMNLNESTLCSTGTRAQITTMRINFQFVGNWRATINHHNLIYTFAATCDAIIRRLSHKDSEERESKINDEPLSDLAPRRVSSSPALVIHAFVKAKEKTLRLESLPLEIDWRAKCESESSGGKKKISRLVADWFSARNWARKVPRSNIWSEVTASMAANLLGSGIWRFSCSKLPPTAESSLLTLKSSLKRFSWSLSSVCCC